MYIHFSNGTSILLLSSSYFSFCFKYREKRHINMIYKYTYVHINIYKYVHTMSYTNMDTKHQTYLSSQTQTSAHMTNHNDKTIVCFMKNYKLKHVQL